MKQFSFEVGKTIGSMRAGTIHTPHGDINTPAFVVVGTSSYRQSTYTRTGIINWCAGGVG